MGYREDIDFMNPADFLEVFRRLGELKARFLDERAHKPHDSEEERPLFLWRMENVQWVSS